MKRWIAGVILCGLCGAAVALAGQKGDKQMQAIMEPDAKIEKLAGDLKFTEGPIWVPDTSASGGHLLFSDIPADTIYKWQPGSKLEVFRNPCGNTNGHTLDLQGRLLSCEHSGRRVSRTEKDGKVVTVASHYNGKKLNSPNDIVVKSDGSIYFTDPPYGIQKAQEELGFSGVYRIGKDGKLTLLTDDFPRPNGLALSPDEKRLYINDSQENHIRVFDVKPDGTLANGRLFADLKTPGKAGVADGLKVDIKGNLYTTGPEGVWVFSPEGKLLGKILTPEVPANCGWGDKDYKTLYMTAQTGLYRVRLKIPGIPPGKPMVK
jgi:sugar lactone lactonase YvrE